MNDGPATIDRRNIWEWFLAACVSFLLVLIVGTLLGLASWAVMGLIYRHANPLLSTAGFLVNVLTLVVVILLLDRAPRFSPRNSARFALAKTVSIIALIELTLTFVATELRGIIIVHIGNLLQFDISMQVWSVVTGVVIPAILLVLLLRIGRGR